MNNIKKAVFYIIFKSKSTIFNMLGVGVLGTLMLVVFQQDQFYSKGTDYLILVFFVVLLGCTLLQANSIIIDLTVKDKMSKRMEFFLASGIDLKFIIKAYTIQILKASIIIPFIIFVLGYYAYGHFPRPSGPRSPARQGHIKRPVLRLAEPSFLRPANQCC